MFVNYTINPIDLVSTKSTTLLQANRFQPELSHFVITLHMDMRWLLAVSRINKQSIWTNTQQRWHFAPSIEVLAILLKPVTCTVL